MMSDSEVFWVDKDDGDLSQIIEAIIDHHVEKACEEKNKEIEELEDIIDDLREQIEGLQDELQDFD